MTELAQEASTSKNDDFLDKAAIIGLTGKRRRPSQLKELNAMAIQHKVRGNGSIAILWAHITKTFDGNPDSARRKAKAVGPNWDAI